MPRDFEKRRKKIAGEFSAGQREFFAGKQKRRLEEIAETAKFEKDIRVALENIREKGAMQRLLKAQEHDFPERQGRLSAQRADLSQKLQDLRVGGKLVEGETGVDIKPGGYKEEGHKFLRTPDVLTGTRKQGLTDIILSERKLGLDRLKKEMAPTTVEAPVAKPGSAAGLGEDVAKPLPRKRGILGQYTDAYMRSSRTPLGYAMGLQGINTAMQAYFKHVGDPFTKRVFRPAVKGLEWLVTPQQRKRKERRIR